MPYGINTRPHLNSIVIVICLVTLQVARLQEYQSMDQAVRYNTDVPFDDKGMYALWLDGPKAHTFNLQLHQPNRI